MKRDAPFSGAASADRARVNSTAESGRRHATNKQPAIKDTSIVEMTPATLNAPPGPEALTAGSTTVTQGATSSRSGSALVSMTLSGDKVCVATLASRVVRPKPGKTNRP